MLSTRTAAKQGKVKAEAISAKNLANFMNCIQDTVTGKGGDFFQLLKFDALLVQVRSHLSTFGHSENLTCEAICDAVLPPAKSGISHDQRLPFCPPPFYRLDDDAGLSGWDSRFGSLGVWGGRLDATWA